MDGISYLGVEKKEMIETIRKLLLVSRPISWPNTAYPFAAAYLVTGGAITPLFFIATLFFLVPYNLLMYGVNDVFDYESDIRNPRKGGIEGMREQKAFHPTILLASIVTSVLFVIVMIVLGTIQASIGLLVLMFFVVAYSLPLLRFKERPIIDSITSSIHFVGPAVYALLLTQFAIEALPYIIAFFVWGMASHALGAIQDIIPDRKGKIASIATVFGARVTLRLVVIAYLLAALTVAMQGLNGLIVGSAALLYVVNAAVYWSVDDTSSALTNRAWRRFIYLNLFVGFVVTMTLLFL